MFLHRTESVFCLIIVGVKIMKRILFLVLSLALYSCSYSRSSGGQDLANPPPSGFTEGEGSSIRFADVDAIVFSAPCEGCQQTCSGCHQAIGLDLNFSDAESTKQKIAEIGQRVFDDQDMPPSGALSETQLKVLRTWIENGAPP